MITLADVNETFEVRTNSTGLYYLKMKGSGNPPEVTKELFTNLRQAVQAAEAYEASKAKK